MVKISKTKSETGSHKALHLLGKALKQRRKILRLTQGELAQMAGMSKNLVCQVENGKATVQACKLLDLLGVLGLHLVLENGNNRILIKDEFLKI